MGGGRAGSCAYHLNALVRPASIVEGLHFEVHKRLHATPQDLRGPLLYRLSAHFPRRASGWQLRRPISWILV